MANNFFQEQREQSMIKARIVAKYFDAWAKVILATQKKYPQHVQRMAYIDLFAGPGRYDDQSKSTPLLVLETILSSPELSERMVSFVEDGLSAASIRLKALLLDEIISRAARGYDTFYCGAARGMDILFGEQALWAKATTYPALRLICVVAQGERAEGWPERWRDRRSRLLERADDVALISTRCALDSRRRCERYMVDRADALLVVCGGSGTGDAAYAVECALEKAVEIVVLNIETLEKSAVPPGEKSR